eukprot:COSAG02_NODE_46784_length_346_cov_0.659919_1_plen_101_part_01
MAIENKDTALPSKEKMFGTRVRSTQHMPHVHPSLPHAQRTTPPPPPPPPSLCKPRTALPGGGGGGRSVAGEHSALPASLPPVRFPRPPKLPRAVPAVHGMP